MRRILPLLVAFAFAMPAALHASPAEAETSLCKKKRKKKRKKRRKSKKARQADALAKAKAEAIANAQAEAKKQADAKKEGKDKKGEAEEFDVPQPDMEAIQAELEAAKAAADAKRKAEGRKQSKLSKGSVSRWSNRGAMVPIQSEVPITAPLPERAVPIQAGVETPGQKLLGAEELLSARVSVSFTHVTTKGATAVFDNTEDDVLVGPLILQDQSRDIQLLRFHGMLAYERIAGTQFGAHIDMESRPRLNGSRPTDHRLNELYVSYGLTDFRRRTETQWWGVSLGRLAIREAGYAQADGLAARFALGPYFRTGAFAGLNTNPYGYNWAQQSPTVFSANWITGGAFASLRMPEVSANVAGVMTLANIPAVVGTPENPAIPRAAESGLDRLYFHTDASWRALPNLNLLLLARIDTLPGGSLVQNGDLSVAYKPIPQVDLRLGVGRFSTVIYQLSTNYSWITNPLGNDSNSGVNAQIVDQQGVPIVPFDGELCTNIYNSVKARAGFRPIRTLDIYTKVDTWIREVKGDDDNPKNFCNQFDFEPLRLLPTVGARFGDPKLLDALGEFTLVVDKQSNAKAFMRARLGRGFEGAYLSGEIRYFLGDIKGFDGGLNLSYTLPRSLFPGALSVNGSFWYYRENLPLATPAIAPTGVLIPDADNVLVPKQESFLGHAGIEWRM